MMQHPEEGTLQAYLDEEIPVDSRAALARHLEACAACRLRLQALQGLELTVRSALPRAELSPAAVGKARWAVRSRRGARADRRRSVAAAASLVLLLGAGAAAAVPGSPLRSWWDARTASEEPAAAAVTSTETSLQALPDAAGVSVAPFEGRVSVSFEAVPEGSWLEIEIVDGERMSVAAPAGSRFETGPGRVHVAVEELPGELRVGLPPTTVEAEVRVNGQLMYVHPDPGGAPAPGAIRRQVPSPAGSGDGPDASSGTTGDVEAGGSTGDGAGPGGAATGGPGTPPGGGG